MSQTADFKPILPRRLTKPHSHNLISNNEATHTITLPPFPQNKTVEEKFETAFREIERASYFYEEPKPFQITFTIAGRYKLKVIEYVGCERNNFNTFEMRGSIDARSISMARHKPPGYTVKSLLET